MAFFKRKINFIHKKIDLSLKLSMTISLILFLALVSGGFLLTIVADMSWGIALYELLYFIYPTNRWWYTIPSVRYTLFLAIILIIVCFFKKKSLIVSGGALFLQLKYLLLMICMMIIISFYAAWPEQHYRFLQLQVQQFIFLYIAYQAIDSECKFDRVLWAFLTGCFYVSYVAYGSARDSFGRVEGIGMPDGPDANTTAAVLNTAIPFLLHFLINGNKIERIISFLFFPFIVNAVILLNSRGAFLGIFIAMVYFLFALLRQKKNFPQIRLTIVFSILVVCLGFFLYLADNVFWERMLTLRDVKVGEGDATRSNFWLIALHLVLEHPFGIGAGGFEFMSPQLLPPEWLTSSGRIAEHNTYVQVLIDFGIMGIVLMGGFILTTLKQVEQIKGISIKRGDCKSYTKGLALETSFVSFLIAIIFINRLYSEVFYWLMLFVAMLTNIYMSSDSPIESISSQNGLD